MLLGYVYRNKNMYEYVALSQLSIIRFIAVKMYNNKLICL